jgi:hypothetical protein
MRIAFDFDVSVVTKKNADVSLFASKVWKNTSGILISNIGLNLGKLDHEEQRHYR